MFRTACAAALSADGAAFVSSHLKPTKFCKLGVTSGIFYPPQQRRGFSSVSDANLPGVFGRSSAIPSITAHHDVFLTFHPSSLGSGPFKSTRTSLQRSSGGNDDYYSILGVSADASAEEVKASYKRLALQYHPDRNKAADAEERFKAISEAYSVVGNKEKRADYDSMRKYSSGSSSSSSSSSYGGAGSTYQGQRGFKHQQGMWQGGQTGRPNGGNYRQQHPHVRTLTREEAEQMFRQIFNMGVEQMAANAQKPGGGVPRGSGLNSNIGSLFANIARESQNQHPFFRPRQGEATESTRVTMDEFGNRSVHRQYRDANGNIYNIYSEESDNPEASMNQTREQVNEKYYDPRTGRYSFGTYGSVGEEKGGGGYTNWGGIKGGGEANANSGSAAGGGNASSSDGSGSSAFPQYAQFFYRNTPVGGNPAIRLLYVFLWTTLVLTLGLYAIIFLFSHPVLLALVLAIMIVRRMQFRRF